MGKRVKAPANFYTAEEAARRLGMPKTTFHTYARQGKIPRVVPPGRTQGFYPRAEIDRLAKLRELVILEYAEQPIQFRKAAEQDLKGIYDVCVSCFGKSGSPSYEQIREWHQTNPETYWVTAQEGIITGYVGFLHLDEETTERIMRQPLQDLPTPPALPLPKSGTIHGLFIGLAVRQDLPTEQARLHGRRLILGAIEVLESWSHRGLLIRKLYATGRSNHGIKLCHKLGFREIVYPDDPIYRFELDLQAKHPLLQKYQRLASRIAHPRESQHRNTTRRSKNTTRRSKGQ
jgi:hypothetical protein